MQLLVFDSLFDFLLCLIGRVMGYSKVSKRSTHDRIVSIAAKRFCELGVNGLSIASLMKEAGLTHGGFYKHFDSRDQLVVEAIEVALRRYHSSQSISHLSFGSVVAEYLSSSHRDSIGTGCPVAALMGDISRQNSHVRDLYTQKLRAAIENISKLMKGAEGEDRLNAIVACSVMVGALGLSRAVSDRVLSSEILVVVQEFLRRSFDPEF
ncbi:TetR/AcrR family transcriptional regulator [Pseudomonas sp. BDPW]|nr:TetR/AcrR family transcriptional regulator [Pseudomonas sp. BDPW]